MVLACSLGLSLFLGGCNPSLRAYRIVGESMLPLFHPGDRIFVDESVGARSDLHDGDVIALRRDDSVVVKRILAMPSETISGDHRKVFRDGKLLNEPYLAPATEENIPELVTFAPRKITEGEVFVMGDNRDGSLDSRAAEYAPVKLSDVVGKYAMTYWHGSSPGK